MVIIAAAAALAAATGMGAKSMFGYNRENFMEDREQRLKMELALRRFRVEQAKLWREDIRGFISLTEKKMEIYLLVNVLMLSFTLNLWCEGRLPERTPEWLVMGNQIAIAGAFSFLLLTVWLAVHASVAAMSYQTRILTQLVRLPVPTWDELEACRTYASDFERIEPKQMFRVPFLQGPQESFVRPPAGTPATVESSSFESTSSMGTSSSEGRQKSPEPEGQAAEAECEEPGAEYVSASEEGGRVESLSGSSATGATGASAIAAADPWGLERGGDDAVYELGCHVGEEVAKLRHIKLIRQAAVYWQTYDAFARVSMSLGVSQLMLAMSYYMLGYVLTQVRAPLPAFTGVAVLMCTAEVVAQIDLTLPKRDQRLVQVLMLFGPSISCVAAYLWAQHRDTPARIAESLAPVAFLSHGAVVALLTTVLRVREQENGAMLPLAYQGVLYLDVFGWVAHKRAVPDDASGAGFGDSSPLAGASWRSHSALDLARGFAGTFQAPAALSPKQDKVPAEGVKKRSWGFGWWRRRSSTAKAGRGNPAEYVNDYVASYIKSSDSIPSLESVEVDGRKGNVLGGCGPPASLCIARDDAGRALPTRPEDVKDLSCADDYRHIAGAPRMHDTVNAIEPPAKEFWDPLTFMPEESQERPCMDEFLAEVPNFNGGGKPRIPGLGTPRDDEKLETGHENEAPGELPWTVVRIAAAITSIIWILAGCQCALQVTRMWSMRLPWWWEIPGLETNESAAVHWHGPPPNLPYMAKTPHMAILQDAFRRPGGDTSIVWPPPPGTASLLAERLVAIWPYPTIRPRSLACDVTGSRFLVSDGLSVFAAKLATPSPLGPKRRRLSHLRQRSELAAAGAGAAPAVRPTANFWRAPPCAALSGDALQDVALLCSRVAAAASAAPGAANSSAPAPPGAGCEALVLHGRSRRLTSCPLAGAAVGRSLSLAQGWLQQAAREGEVGEEVASVLADPDCDGGSIGAFGSSCAWVGTTRGRVARLRVGADAAQLVPGDVMAGVGGGSPLPAVGSVRPLAGGRLAALGRGSRLLRLFTAEGRGAAGDVSARLELPGEEPPSAFCTGGGFIYALGAGPAPELWRFPMPGEGGPAAAAHESRTAAA